MNIERHKNMQNRVVRQARREDAERIAVVVNSAYRPRPGAEGWTHEGALISGARINKEQVIQCLQDGTVLVGLSEGSVVGCVHIREKGSEAHIGMLAVDASLQTAGLGKWLLAEAEAYAQSQLGAESFVLIVIDTRAELINFYCRRGYRETGEKLAFPVGTGVGTPIEEGVKLTLLRKPAKAHSPGNLLAAE